MNKIVFLCSLLFAILSANTQNSYKIVVKTNQIKDSKVYLLYQMDNTTNQFIEDSSILNKQQVVFTKNKSLQKGIYKIYFEKNKYNFEFLVDKEQNLDITIVDTLGGIEKIKFTKSNDNKMFFDYMRFISKLGPQLDKARNQIMAENDEVKKNALIEKSKPLYGQIDLYRNNIIKTAPSSMLAAMFNAMKETKILNEKPKTRADSLENYYNYREHFWDGINFMDDRIIRTPFLKPKLEKYYRELLPQISDTIISDISNKLLLARNNQEMFKYLLNWFTDEYINPKYLGLDAVFVDLFQRYHSQNLSPWLNEKQKKTISDRAYMTMKNLVGTQAANLNMLDINDKPIALYDVAAKYTLVVFWDPNCGHCKEEIPRIDSFYKASWKGKGLKVFSVLSEDAKTDFVKFINEKKINDFINVYQTKAMADELNKNNQPGFRQLYDVITTPTILLLDNEKKIKLKKVDLKSINDYLELELKNKK